MTDLLAKCRDLLEKQEKFRQSLAAWRQQLDETERWLAARDAWRKQEVAEVKKWKS